MPTWKTRKCPLIKSILYISGAYKLETYLFYRCLKHSNLNLRHNVSLHNTRSPFKSLLPWAYNLLSDSCSFSSHRANLLGIVLPFCPLFLLRDAFIRMSYRVCRAEPFLVLLVLPLSLLWERIWANGWQKWYKGGRFHCGSGWKRLQSPPWQEKHNGIHGGRSLWQGLLTSWLTRKQRDWTTKQG